MINVPSTLSSHCNLTSTSANNAAKTQRDKNFYRKTKESCVFNKVTRLGLLYAKSITSTSSHYCIHLPQPYIMFTSQSNAMQLID